MKRIGVLTVHRSLNYGAVLQAYALIRVLSEHSFDATIIDYVSEAVEERERKIIITLKDIVKYIVRANKYLACKKKEKRFKEFADNYYIITNQTFDRKNISQVELKFDYFVTGSDQIWNFDITNSDTVFMLDFVADNNKKKSYAASFGYGEIPEKYKAKTKEMLSQYSSLLVRENSGVQILQEMGLKGCAVLDPTLLLSGDQWSDIALPYEGEKYILIYTVSAPTYLYEVANKMATKLGLKIKVIKLEPAKGQFGMEQIYDAGPLEFLSLVKNAECIFTTSFHGLAFSLNLRKEVYFEADTSKNNNTTRLTHLASLLGVMNRRITTAQIDDFIDNPIDWTSVHDKLKKEREKSMAMLLNSLK